MGGPRRAAAALLAMGLLVGAAACDPIPDPGEPPPTPTPIDYVALGDSYSSGEGAPPDLVSGDPCHQAAAAWPRRLDADSAQITSLDHRACSGATTARLLDAWTSRGLPAEIPDEPDSSIDLVTLTIGGNDAGFGDLVTTCVLWICPSPDDADLQASLATLVTTLEDEVYPALHEAYPNARIAHVGYPRLTPPLGQPSRCLWLPGSDQAAAAGIVDALNGAIADAASGSGITYVDVTDVMAGHELCTLSPWIKGIPSSGQAHPNAKGQVAIEQAVAAALVITLD